MIFLFDSSYMEGTAKVSGIFFYMDDLAECWIVYNSVYAVTLYSVGNFIRVISKISNPERKGFITWKSVRYDSSR